MKNKLNRFKIFFFLTMGMMSSHAVLSEESFEVSGILRGQIVDKVASKRFQGQNYVIYLPRNYVPEKKWPILYCFDPDADGKVPLGLFHESAEKYGYILAGSNNVRANDPSFEIFPSVKAIWEDTHAWFAIDEKRVYATGFSGGARIACNLGLFYKGQVTGVIGCGAGFPPDHPPARDLPFGYYGTVGNIDFNFQEMKTLDHELDSLGIPHHIETFDGRHQWAPPELCTAAIEWMEIQAMKNNVRTKEDALVDSLFYKRTSEAQALRNQGQTYDALIHYEATVHDFQGLRDVSILEPKITELRNSIAVKKYIKEQQRVDREEEEYNQKILSILTEIHSTPPPLPLPGKLVNELGISRLQEKVAKEGKSQKGILARRLLENIVVQTAFFLPQDLILKKEYSRAILSLSSTLR